MRPSEQISLVDFKIEPLTRRNFAGMAVCETAEALGGSTCGLGRV